MKQYNLFEAKSYLQLEKRGDLDHYLYEIYWHSRTVNGLLASGYLVKSEPDLSLVLVGQVKNKSRAIQTLYPREFTNEPLPHQIYNIIDGETLIIDANQGSLKLQAWIPKNERTPEIIELLRSRIIRLSKLKTETRGVFFWRV